jgi:ubiquinone/menaquinone biosynthesis C-methylase UbiE
VQKLSDRLVEHAGIKPGNKMLDIATGIGEPAITAAKKVGPNGQVVVIDISAGMLAIAREHARSLKLDGIVAFEESDVETYAYPSSSMPCFHAGFNVLSRYCSNIETDPRFACSKWGVICGSLVSS